jgi:hypothetical protein
MSRSFIFIAIVLFSVAVDATARERRVLSGDIAGDLDAGEYIVKSALTVPAGERLSLSAGTTLYFEQLTGIDVNGELRADGERGAPVVLTSVSDTAGSIEPAQPFDWNGVKAHGPASALRLRHARIGNSVYGVSVRSLSTRAEFVDVVFDNNGYASLARGEHVVSVTPGEPFSARWNVRDDDAPALPEPELSEREPVPASVKAVLGRREGRARTIIQASAASVAAAGLTISIVNLANLNTYYKHYSRDDNPQRLAEYYEKKIRGSINVGTLGAVITGVGLSYIGVTLLF